MKSILDPTFRYVPAASTDLRKTFARVRREQRATADEQARIDVANQARVQSIFAKRREAK